jgi:hypothetical protein
MRDLALGSTQPSAMESMPRLTCATLLSNTPGMTNNSFTSLSAQQLRRAAGIKEKIEALQRELTQLLGGSAPAKSAPSSKPKRKMTAAGRARISAAAKARWAKLKEVKAGKK